METSSSGDFVDFVVISALVGEGERSFRYSLTWLSRMDQVSTPAVSHAGRHNAERRAFFSCFRPSYRHLLGIFLGSSNRVEAVTDSGMGRLRRRAEETLPCWPRQDGPTYPSKLRKVR
jgi:hypothetical protein